MTLDIVVGGMYGSEAKGHATQRILERRRSEGSENLWNIRIGGPNAGHTGHDEHGTPWAFRQVPVGVLLPGKGVNLEIGAGSEIDLPVLLDEIDRCIGAGLLDGKWLVVHGEATMIEDRHKETEAALVGSIGSTGKGIGAARADRLLRGAKRLSDDPEAVLQLVRRGVTVVHSDSGDWREVPGRETDVVIEGTQGYALGLRAGHYPKSTTSDCRAIDFLSMAGISPWDYRYGARGATVWVVARVYPIRVAGNSGFMKGETTWEELGLAQERTTVTQKIRRVGLPDWDLLAAAVKANGGTPAVRVALSMIDQAYPELADKPYDGGPEWELADQFMNSIEDQVGARIALVMSGPNMGVFR